MKKLYILLALCALAFTAHAHAVLTGTVTSPGGAPLHNVIVQLTGPRTQYNTTNEFGEYRFSSLDGGAYTLTFSLLGYKRTVKEVQLVDNNSTLADVVLEEAPLNMQEVTVSPVTSLASRSLSGLDLKLRPVNTTQDLMRLVPGLFIAQHAGGGKAEQIFLRGFDVDHGTDVAVTVDGMPVNMVSHAHGQGYADLHFVIPEMVENLSFSKGPYEARTGDLNTAGAVRFETRQALPRSFVKLEGGQYGYTRGVAALNLLGTGPEGEVPKQNAYIAAEYMNTDGFFENNQNFKRLNLLAKYNYTLNPGSTLSLSASHFSSRWNASGQIPTRAVDQGIITRLGSIDPTEGGQTSRQNLNMILTQKAGAGVFRNQLFYSHYAFNLYSNFTFNLHDSVNGDEIRQYETRDIFGYNGSYQVSHELGDKTFTTTVGANLRNDEISPIGLAHVAKRHFINDVKKGDISQANGAVYLQEQMFLSSRFTATVGVRADVFRFSYDNKLDSSIGSPKVKGIISPKLNLSYNVTEKAQFYLSAGTGFHSNDARAVTQVPSDVNTNTNKALPRASGADLGLNLRQGRNLFINAAVWVLDLENEFVYVGDEGVIEVNGYTRRIGADLSARYQITPWLFADLDVNVTRPRYTGADAEGARYVPLAPTLTSIGGLSIRNLKGFSASLRYRHLGDRPANEDNSLKALGYTVTDAVATFATGSYTFGVSAENIFNVKWREAQFETESRLRNESASTTQINFTPGTPTFVKGNITYSF